MPSVGELSEALPACHLIDLRLNSLGSYHKTGSLSGPICSHHKLQPEALSGQVMDGHAS